MKYKIFLLLHRACCYNYCVFQLTHLYTLKHQLTLTFKTLKNCFKHFSDVAPTCFGPLIRPSSGGHMPYFVLLLDWVPLMCVRWLCSMWLNVLTVSLCVCVTGALVRVRSGYGIHNQISPWQEHQSHTQTDSKHRQPHTAQTINKRKSAESNLVTARSTAYDPLRMVEWVDRNM